ncbi:isoaspartyl peptidase/L-asparaginase [Sphingomonas sp. JC676]|uniref:isoaspartyl peptidase/L-asparaginase family protein n=1 Tax=Sphingomonas sp. JC676 TaxID=2768065 RepID=UPI001657BFC8|nr:isoaspartyl peptidase/L-asparaginase family protein [Sphingomonas sp. JC676]MBC9033806.1 isoaspartyl peptidase/L-asparaginase [Sphingomonas sp. JC676]
MHDADGCWALIVHGGAKSVAPDQAEANRAGSLAAAQAGAEVLRYGGSALAAAEAAVRCLEDDANFNAGIGSVPNADGDIEMDAAIMDGTTLAVGAVAAVRRIRNPIGTAAKMLEAVPVLLVAEGAERFARDQGVPLCEPRERLFPLPACSIEHDTVGCVAIDAAGHIAAATSTGGLSGQHPGRVGDSPIPGAGLYADDQLGGVAFSGDGESILRTLLAARVMQALETETATPAAEAAIARLARVGGEAGAIVIDKTGRIGVAHNSEHFALALHASWLPDARAALHSSELKDVLDHD